MNTDIRISASFPTHPKTRKLSRRLGAPGVLSLVYLWLFVGQNRPEGDLRGLDDEDIALAAQWDGEPDEFVGALVEVGFLEHNESGFAVYDWANHNPYAARSKERSLAAKRSIMVRWAISELRREGREAETGQFKEWLSSREYCGETWEQTLAEYDRNTGRIRAQTKGNTPSPSPIPFPDPSPKESSSPRGEGSDHTATYRTKKGRTLKGRQLEWFEQFWATFDYKTGKADAADAWLDLKVTETTVPEILRGAKREADSRSALRESGRTPKMAQGWLSGRRWEDDTGQVVQFAQREPMRVQEADY